MKKEELDQIKDLLSYGDIKVKRENEYSLTDKAVVKLINEIMRLRETSKDYILCAAIYYNDGKKREHQPRNIESGIVVCGRRHHNCIMTAIEFSKSVKQDLEEGFITSKDKFVNREVALEIAKRANQILDLSKVRGNKLYSEDLY